MIGDQELRIRERAHRIWEHEGRPEGRATAHWQLASAEVAAESTGRATRPAAKAATGSATAKAARKPRPAPAPAAAARAAEPKRSSKATE